MAGKPHASKRTGSKLGDLAPKDGGAIKGGKKTSAERLKEFEVLVKDKTVTEDESDRLH